MSPLEAEWLHWLTEVAVLASAATIIAWVIQYSAYQPWWTDPVGRTFVWKDIMLLGLLVPVAVAAYVRLTPGQIAWLDWYVVASLLGIPVVVLWRMRVWYVIHRDLKRGKKKP